MAATWAIWAVAAVSIAGLLWRPANTPQWSWALAGSIALPALGLLPWRGALDAVLDGGDVYAFLVGMMLLSELARREGLFDLAAEFAVRRSRGSARRLFAWVYGIGTVVTVLLSNDATAVVLTPAVCATCRCTGARPLPHLLACAFVANAASFVLPISNPANLVVFGERLPPLGEWMMQFGLPSLASIGVTFAALGLLQRRTLREGIGGGSSGTATGEPGGWTTDGARDVAVGIGATVVVLLVASSAGYALGLPALLAASAVALRRGVARPSRVGEILRGVFWSVLPLVAGLFVMVAALERSGVRDALLDALERLVRHAPTWAPWLAGAAVALASNLVNSLPAGLLAGDVLGAMPAWAMRAGAELRAAVAIGIDLGPNLSVTGSLATILWLAAIRREGERVDAATFLRNGAVVMPLGLAAALGMAWLQSA